MTSSNGNIFRVTGLCVGNLPVTGEFPTQRPVTRSFDVFFDLRLNKRLSKQWWGWWVETPSSPLWRRCNGLNHSHLDFHMTVLTHWGRVTITSVSNVGHHRFRFGWQWKRRKAIIWTNDAYCELDLWKKINEIWIKIPQFSLKKINFKMSSAARWPFCHGLNVLNKYFLMNRMLVCRRPNANET